MPPLQTFACLLSFPQKVAAELGAPHTSCLFPQVLSVACLNHHQQTSRRRPVPCAELAPRTAGSSRESGEWGKRYLCTLRKSSLIRCESVPLTHTGPSARSGGLSTPNKVASDLFKYFLHAFCVGLRIHVCVCTFVSFCVCLEGRRQPWVSFFRVPSFS